MNEPKRPINQAARGQKKPISAKVKAKYYSFIKLSGILIIFLLALFAVLSIHGRDKQYSENENRYLQARPDFSLSSIFEGRFTENMEAYLSDHFFARDVMVKSRTLFDITLGKKEINNVYVGKKHFLFEKPSEYTKETTGKTIKAINKFTKNHSTLPSYIALIPNSNEILFNYLPKNAPTQNQKEQIEKVYSSLKGVSSIDAYSPLGNSENKENLYYKTDHHWTTEAARTVFPAIKKKMKFESEKVKFQTFCISNSFQGTLSSSTGLSNAYDNIFITVPKTDVDYVVTFTNENKKSASVFEKSKLNQKNQYEVFLGGNYAQVVIQTAANSDRTLLLVKDSYANCLVPMLIPFYKKIVMIDPRYYTDNIEDTIQKENPTEVLWLYNVNTFLNDTSIVNVFN